MYQKQSQIGHTLNKYIIYNFTQIYEAHVGRSKRANVQDIDLGFF